jgi:hypothetical protein
MRLRDRSLRPALRRRLPEIEGLEARDLPSTAALLTGAAYPGVRPRQAAVQPAPRLAGSLGQPQLLGQVVESPGVVGHGPGTPFPDPAVIQQSINLLYGPNSQTPRVPTPREVKRETFIARWIGTYTVGPPRYSDRASTIHVYAVSGGSNQFLKGKFQMVLFPPADPNATPNPGNPYANQVTGEAGLINQNFLQTGGIAVIDLNGTPAPGSDPQALPTHLNWTFDSTSSAGTYTAPSSDFNQGTGVLDIQYFPDAHPQAGTMGSGRVIVSFQGVINYSQLISDVSKVYN